MPETRNSSGIPHSDPHSMKALKPMLGRGSVTNQDVPTANTAAEWNATSPATTRARPASSSGRRPPEPPGAGRAAAVPAAAGTITELATVLLPSGRRCRPRCQSRRLISSGRGRDFDIQPKAYEQPPACPRLGLPDDTAPQPRGLGLARRSRGTGPAATAGSGTA